MTLFERLNEAKFNYFKDIKSAMCDDDIYNVLADLTEDEVEYTPEVTRMMNDLFNYNEDWYLDFFTWMQHEFSWINTQEAAK